MNALITISIFLAANWGTITNAPDLSGYLAKIRDNVNALADWGLGTPESVTIDQARGTVQIITVDRTGQHRIILVKNFPITIGQSESPDRRPADRPQQGDRDPAVYDSDPADYDSGLADYMQEDQYYQDQGDQIVYYYPGYPYTYYYPYNSYYRYYYYPRTHSGHGRNLLGRRRHGQVHHDKAFGGLRHDKTLRGGLGLRGTGHGGFATRIKPGHDGRRHDGQILHRQDQGRHDSKILRGRGQGRHDGKILRNRGFGRHDSKILRGRGQGQHGRKGFSTHRGRFGATKVFRGRSSHHTKQFSSHRRGGSGSKSMFGKRSGGSRGRALGGHHRGGGHGRTRGFGGHRR